MALRYVALSPTRPTRMTRLPSGTPGWASTSMPKRASAKRLPSNPTSTSPSSPRKPVSFKPDGIRTRFASTSAISPWRRATPSDAEVLVASSGRIWPAATATRRSGRRPWPKRLCRAAAGRSFGSPSTKGGSRTPRAGRWTFSNRGLFGNRGRRVSERLDGFNRGYVALREGQPARALAHFEAALVAGPLDWSQFSYEDALANAYLELGRLDDAIAEYRRILADQSPVSARQLPPRSCLRTQGVCRRCPRGVRPVSRRPGGAPTVACPNCWMPGAG